MLYSEIKSLYENLDNNRELIELIVNDLDADEYEANGYMLIKESEIFEYVKNSYEGDAYMLGCFNASFIADNTNLTYDIVTALQEGEKFEAIGEYIIENDNTDEMISEYIRLDVYGACLSSYDGNYEEIEIDNIDYIYVRMD